MNQEDLADKLVEHRTRLGLSLRSVAAESGVSASTLSRIECGRTTVDFDNYARLVQWLGSSRISTTAAMVYETDILAAICRVIRNDRGLTAYAREFLCDLMTMCYQDLVALQGPAEPASVDRTRLR